LVDPTAFILPSMTVERASTLQPAPPHFNVVKLRDNLGWVIIVG